MNELVTIRGAHGPSENREGGVNNGGGKNGGTGSGGATEAPNTLRSIQVAKVIDLISSGPIVGFVDGARSFYYDGVPLQNPDGSLNFNQVEIDARGGWPNQPPMPGFASSEAETAVGLQIKVGTDLVRSVQNVEVDRIRVTVSVPSLMVTNTDSGDTNGTAVTFEILCQSRGAGYQSLGPQTISGKTTSRYQRSYVFTPVGKAPWDIKLRRLTPDSTKVALQNDIYWDSFTEIIDDRINYEGSFVIGTSINAEQFQSIPKRVYHCDGLYLLIPNNYDPFTRTYTGAWDGTFQYQWSNNPAWVFLYLLWNVPNALGQWVGLAQVDKWGLYRIAQWCDELVDDGRGGQEPRFTCNVWITEAQEAYDLLASIASIFRGYAYWAAGQMVAVADQPTDAIGQYTNATVLDGQFSYAGSDIKSRHNQFAVAWSDPTNLGETRIAVVEDQDDIARRGIQKTDVVAFGCTSEAQAIRVGKWTLYTETQEGEVNTWRVGIEGAWCRPGDVVKVLDVLRTGKRRGGRVLEGSTEAAVLVDAPVELLAGEVAYLNVYGSGAGAITAQPVAAISGDGMTVYPAVPFASVPAPGTGWSVVSADFIAPTYWRILKIVETESGVYEISALAHRLDKWAYVERGAVLAEYSTNAIARLQKVTNLHVTESVIQLSPISLGINMLISWTSTAPQFQVKVNVDFGNPSFFRTVTTACEMQVVTGRTYTISVTPINALGQNGTTVTTVYTVVGFSAAPIKPREFRMQQVNGIALLSWGKTTDIDVLIGGGFELRYSPRLSGVNWTSAITQLASVSGTATSVEVPYRPGTYLLRSRDILGNLCEGAATITAGAQDKQTVNVFRIVEDPGFTGQKLNVVIQAVTDWLILGTTGGSFDDDQLPIDSWPTIDVLPYSPDDTVPEGDQTGIYYFANNIDLGGVFSTRLTVDMFAFPLSNASLFIGARTGNVDDWQSWDDPTDDLGGSVQIQVRSTDDDPNSTSPLPTWSAWQLFTSSFYEARGFEFRAAYSAPDGQNVAIENLAVTADISNKNDQGSDVVWTGVKMSIAFSVKFYDLPAVNITVQEGVAGDRWRVTNKTRLGFDIEIMNAGGTLLPASSRTFDWIAAGY